MKQRLIDANNLSDIIGSMTVSIGGKDIFPYEAKRSVLYAIADCDTIEAEPVRHGRWIAQDNTFTRFMCSECKSKNHRERTDYCPNCGAKMDLEEEA